VQEEPDSVTMGIVPERGRSLTPEPRARKGSFDVGIDVDARKPSLSPDVHNDAMEQTAADVPPLPSVADQLNISTDHGAVSAVESSHSPHDSTHVKESTHDSDTGRKKKKKKKKRHSSAAKDNSSDVGHTAVKEHSKHRHKDRSHGTKEKDETHKKEDGSKMSNKNNMDDLPHSDYEAKEKQSVDGAKRREITDDKINSESISDKRKKSDDILAFKLSDDQSGTKASKRGAKIVRQYRHQDGIREWTIDKTTASHNKRERKSVSVFSLFCGI